MKKKKGKIKSEYICVYIYRYFMCNNRKTEREKNDTVCCEETARLWKQFIMPRAREKECVYRRFVAYE